MTEPLILPISEKFKAMFCIWELPKSQYHTWNKIAATCQDSEGIIAYWLAGRGLKVQKRGRLEPMFCDFEYNWFSGSLWNRNRNSVNLPINHKTPIKIPLYRLWQKKRKAHEFPNSIRSGDGGTSCKSWGSVSGCLCVAFFKVSRSIRDYACSMTWAAGFWPWNEWNVSNPKSQWTRRTRTDLYLKFVLR